MLDEDDGSWHSECNLEVEYSEAKCDANKCEPVGQVENDAKTENDGKCMTNTEKYI